MKEEYNRLYNSEDLKVLAETEVAVDDILEEVDPKGFLTREVYMSPNQYIVNVIIRRKHRMTYAKESFILHDVMGAFLAGALHEFLEPSISKLATSEL